MYNNNHLFSAYKFTKIELIKQNDYVYVYVYREMN